MLHQCSFVLFWNFTLNKMFFRKCELKKSNYSWRIKQSWELHWKKPLAHWVIVLITFYYLKNIELLWIYRLFMMKRDFEIAINQFSYVFKCMYSKQEKSYTLSFFNTSILSSMAKITHNFLYVQNTNLSVKSCG